MKLCFLERWRIKMSISVTFKKTEKLQFASLSK